MSTCTSLSGRRRDVPLTRKHVLFGAISATAAAAVALDATLGKPTNYPVWHRWFGEDWIVARNITFLVLSLIAAFFGYLTLNVKNGNGSG